MIYVVGLIDHLSFVHHIVTTEALGGSYWRKRQMAYETCESHGRLLIYLAKIPYLTGNIVNYLRGYHKLIEYAFRYLPTLLHCLILPNPGTLYLSFFVSSLLLL